MLLTDCTKAVGSPTPAMLIADVATVRIRAFECDTTFANRRGVKPDESSPCWTKPWEIFPIAWAFTEHTNYEKAASTLDRLLGLAAEEARDHAGVLDGALR